MGQVTVDSSRKKISLSAIRQNENQQRRDTEFPIELSCENSNLVSECDPYYITVLADSNNNASVCNVQGKF